MRLIRNLILSILNHIVGLAAPALRALLDDAQHVDSSLFLGGLRHEASTELLDGLTAETRQARVQHQRHQANDSLLVWSKTHIIKSFKQVSPAI